MSHNDQNSVITTFSGIFGGVGKALSNYHVFANISMKGVFEVAFYAAISALVGFGVKVLIDYIQNKIRK